MPTISMLRRITVTGQLKNSLDKDYFSVIFGSNTSTFGIFGRNVSFGVGRCNAADGPPVKFGYSPETSLGRQAFSPREVDPF